MKKILGMVAIILVLGALFSACTQKTENSEKSGMVTPQPESAEMKVETPTPQSTEVDSLEMELGSLKLEDESFE